MVAHWGSRCGRNRLRIVRTLEERPMNTNQLSNELDLKALSS